jgi:hypothetical protein
LPVFAVVVCSAITLDFLASSDGSPANSTHISPHVCSIVLWARGAISHALVRVHMHLHPLDFGISWPCRATLLRVRTQTLRYCDANVFHRGLEADGGEPCHLLRVSHGGDLCIDPPPLLRAGLRAPCRDICCGSAIVECQQYRRATTPSSAVGRVLLCSGTATEVWRAEARFVDRAAIANTLAQHAQIGVFPKDCAQPGVSEN